MVLAFVGEVARMDVEAFVSAHCGLHVGMLVSSLAGTCCKNTQRLFKKLLF